MVYFTDSRDSAVGITTGYGLDTRSSIPGGGKIFLFFMVSRPALGPTQLPIQWALREGGGPPRGKVAGA
jgi:hypothetical protein